MNIGHCDWFNKQADHPIAEQDKVRQESQTENDRKKKNGAGESPADAEKSKMGILY